jgi:peptidoglycan/xylan/chitin deacetylase (PgdA/CDA1 family)
LILAYHAVDRGWASSLAITEESLAEQASLLSSRGYVGLTASEAERRRDAGALPRRSVVFTFDDGYSSTMRAASVLSRFGYPGTVFIATSYADDALPFSWYGVDTEPRDKVLPLTWNEVGALADEGWEIGSHTVTHPLLTTLADEPLERELAVSRARIAEAVGACDSVAYPYGQADARVAAAARRAGYCVGVTLTGAVVADERMRRPRVGLFTQDIGPRLRVKLSAPGLAARRSPVARAVRRLRPTRDWLPNGGEAW